MFCETTFIFSEGMFHGKARSEHSRRDFKLEKQWKEKYPEIPPRSNDEDDLMDYEENNSSAEESTLDANKVSDSENDDEENIDEISDGREQESQRDSKELTDQPGAIDEQELRTETVSFCVHKMNIDVFIYVNEMNVDVFIYVHKMNVDVFYLCP